MLEVLLRWFGVASRGFEVGQLFFEVFLHGYEVVFLEFEWQLDWDSHVRVA